MATSSGNSSDISGGKSNMPGDKKTIDINELKNLAKKMGLTPDVRDMIDAFTECRQTLEKKSLELNILATIAMESDDENISELREQMFTVVKLLYSDIIVDIMKDHNNGYVSEYDGYSSYLGEQSVLSKQSILNRMRTYINNRSKYKEQLAIIKKRLKKNMELL